MNSLTSLIFYLIIFLSVIAARILFLIQAEKYFGSSTTEKVHKIKNDSIVLISLSLVVLKIAEYVFSIFSSNHKWWDFIVISLLLLLSIYFFIWMKLNRDFGKKNINGWRKTRLISKIFLLILLLFSAGYWAVLVKVLFFE